MENEKQDEFYKKFKERLEDTTEFPSDFIYKFIIPTDHKRIAEVHRIFDDATPKFQMKESKTGKYTSVTVIVFVLDADQVIRYYREAARIEDIIML
ncbi:MAG: DUF493 domain-containing protein [Weeksellaceae bacterium]